MRRLQGIRKIINGKIRFFGKDYIPIDLHYPYNGQLDGQKWFFIGYQPHQDMVAMWGDEQRYKASRSEEEYDKDCDSRQEANIIDGFIVWYIWKPL